MTTTLVDLFLFIDQNATAIYAICIAFLLIWVWRLRSAHRELSRAHFELEREKALNRRARAVDVTVLVTLLILAVTAITQVVAPHLRENPITPNRFDLFNRGDQFITRVPGMSAQPAGAATPAPDIMAGASAPDVAAAVTRTPSPTVMVQRATDVFSGEVEATHTPTSTPPGTLMPDPPASVGCTDESTVLTLPVNGQRLYETVVVRGSASTAGFSAYKFELKGPDTDDQWAVLRTYTTPVTDGVLGQFDGSAFTPGVYQLRLAVVDNEDNTIASCAITVEIATPPYTPTPIRY